MSDLSYKESPFRNVRARFSEDNNEMYFDLRVTPDSDNTRYIHCSRKYIALRWRDSDVAGDSIAVLLYEDQGKHISFAPLFVTGQPDMTDFLWSPFNDDLIATASSDGTVKVFLVPEKGPRKRMDKPLKVLDHRGRSPCGVGSIAWNPVAEGILACGSGNEIHVWDVNKGERKFVLEGIEENVVCIDWNWNGTHIAAAAGNRVFVFDARSGSLITSFEAHKSTFPVKLHWAGRYNYIFTSGQNRYENRQVKIFDGTSGAELKTMPFEQSFSALNFAIDVDSNILYACGRGDDHMKRFQLLENEPYCKILTALGGKEHFRGFGLIPKSRMDFFGMEVTRIFQVTHHDLVPLSIRAYGRERGFYEDLFPPTKSATATLTADQWVAGATAEPTLEPINPGVDNYVPPVVSDEITEEFYTLQKMNIVRSTKYNYINGEPAMESKCFKGLNLATTPALNRTIAGNGRFFAVPWAGNGGRLAVFGLDNPRRIGSKFPSIETQFVIHDFEFDPYNDQIVAIGGGDATIKLYDVGSDGIPDGQLISDYVVKLSGHRGKIGCIGYHPTVANILASAAIDKTVRLWDVEAQRERRNIKDYEEAVNNFDWNYNGDLMVTCAKDRSVKIFDMRQQNAIHTGTDTGGTKGAKVAWLRNHDKIFVVGFGKESDRRYKILDVRNMDEALCSEYIDRDSSVLTPHFDEDTGVIALWGRGDTSIKFFEIVGDAPYCHYLTQYNSLDLQSGVAFLHKTLVDPTSVEILKALKLRDDSMVPISFKVPRTRVEYFQDDIYVPTRERVTSLSTEEFFNGEIPSPPTLDLNPGLELLSSAPVEEIVIKKFVQGDRVIDDADVAENTINKLYDTLMSHKEEEDDIIPGDELDGVDSDE
jgi:WD40 repeat protein